VWSTLPTDASLPFNSSIGIGPLTGTSMAAPHVTALVALLLGINPALRLDDALALLATNADKVGGEGNYGPAPNDVCLPKHCSWNNRYGFGRINVSRTLCDAGGNRPQVQKVFPNFGPPSGGTSVRVTGACFSKDVQRVDFGGTPAPAFSIQVVSP